MKANLDYNSIRCIITHYITRDSNINQVSDLMLIQKPQTSVWGDKANCKAASERRFMVVYRLIIALLFIVALLLGSPSIEARKIKTKHTIHKISEKTSKANILESSDSISLSSDSITFVDKILPSIRFYGFDKTVTSSMESFFISNALDSEISGMEIRITYFDMQGRQLHKRNVSLDVKVPPHETVRTDIKTWDTQKSFYFHQSAKPKRQATPFSVKITLLSIKQEREATQPPLKF